MLNDGRANTDAGDEAAEEKQNATLDPDRRARSDRRRLRARSEERAPFGVEQQNRPLRGAFAQVEANGERPDFLAFGLCRTQGEAHLEERGLRGGSGRGGTRSACHSQRERWGADGARSMTAMFLRAPSA